MSRKCTHCPHGSEVGVIPIFHSNFEEGMTNLNHVSIFFVRQNFCAHKPFCLELTQIFDHFRTSSTVNKTKEKSQNFDQTAEERFSPFEILKNLHKFMENHLNHDPNLFNEPTEEISVN